MAKQGNIYLSQIKNRSPVDSLDNSNSRTNEQVQLNNSPSKMKMPTLNMESVNNALLKLQNIGANNKSTSNVASCITSPMTRPFNQVLDQ